MKKIFQILGMVAALGCTACEDKLDIVPLGETTLTTVDELETLLNQEPLLYQLENHFEILCNNTYTDYDGLPDFLANPNSIIYALVTYDESVDRANLTTSNSLYEDLYSNINYMNVVISKAPEVSGDDAKRRQIVAEARVLRAWYHYLLVNMFARQYDDATAGELGGIAYVDNTHVGEQKTKLTLAQVYERILQDCNDEVLADLVQDHVSTPCRFGLDFGYGVRAKALFQMKHYDEALRYANLALGVNARIEDRTTVKTTANWILDETAQNNYYLIWAKTGNMGDLGGLCISADLARLIDPNDYVYKYYYQDGAPAWAAPYPTLPDGCLQCQVWDIHWNVFGLRAESMYYLAAECMIRSGTGGPRACPSHRGLPAFCGPGCVADGEGGHEAVARLQARGVLQYVREFLRPQALEQRGRLCRDHCPRPWSGVWRPGFAPSGFAAVGVPLPTECRLAQFVPDAELLSIQWLVV